MGFLAVPMVVLMAISGCVTSQASLNQAMDDGDFQRVREALEAGADPNAYSVDVSWRPKRGEWSDQMYRLLMEDYYDRVKTPLGFAMHGSMEPETFTRTLDLLVRAGTNIDGDNAVFSAASTDKCIEKESVPHNHPLSCGGPPLLHAFHHHHSYVLPLIRAGADPRVRNGDGLTALHWVARESWVEFMGPVEFIGALVGAGADLEARDGEGRTALHWAASSGQPEIMKALVDAGADPDATDNLGRTPLDYID